MTEMGEQMRLDVKQMVHHRHRDTFARPTLSLYLKHTKRIQRTFSLLLLIRARAG